MQSFLDISSHSRLSSGFNWKNTEVDCFNAVAALAASFVANASKMHAVPVELLKSIL